MRIDGSSCEKFDDPVDFYFSADRNDLVGNVLQLIANNVVDDSCAGGNPQFIRITPGPIS